MLIIKAEVPICMSSPKDDVQKYDPLHVCSSPRAAVSRAQLHKLHRYLTYGRRIGADRGCQELKMKHPIAL